MLLSDNSKKLKQQENHVIKVVINYLKIAFNIYSKYATKKKCI